MQFSMQRAVTVCRAATVALGMWGAAPGAAVAASPHDHGVARLDIAVSADRLSLQFDSPLDNLLGFERAPRTDAERTRAADVARQLRDGAGLFRIDPAAGCTLAATQLVAPELGLEAPAGREAAGARDGHADVDARWDFDCKAAARAGFVETTLFQAFPKLQRIEVQAATPKGQLKALLRRPNGRVALAR